MKKISILLFVVVYVCAACQPAAPVVQEPKSPTAEVLPATEGVDSAAEDNNGDENPIYLDASYSPEERAADLVSRMTLDEKIGQMTLIEKGSLPFEAVTDYLIGGVLSGGGGTPFPNTPEAWAKMVDQYQEAALETRLAIPVIYGVDAVHGHNNLKDAVIFPHSIGLGASGDADLVRRVAQATAEEMIGTNIYWNYSPVVAVPQDIRWGRTYEGFGEDTTLVTELGTAYLEGLQGASLSDANTVLGTPKHFIGDGGTEWGSSTTSNYQIDQGDMIVDEETLRELYLPPYQAAIEAGAQSIMVSFSSWQGTKMHAHDYLLNDVLKGELGFDGFLVSDWQAIDQIDRDYYAAVVQSINAGIDMNMVPIDYFQFIKTMQTAVEAGDISEERINDAVYRILKVKFSMGLFEQPFSNPDYLKWIGTEEHRLIAREAVAKSLVLLKNENGVLPLDKEIPVVFMAGEPGDNIGIQCGGWTIEWQGKSGDITAGTTIKDAVMETSLGTVHYNRFAKFDNFTDAQGQPLVADVGIVVIAEKPYAEGIGDQGDLSLNKTDVELITRMQERSNQVVVILLSGRPLVIAEHLDLAEAWVAAWLPGTEGLGIADVLFGEQPFIGKTPYTWPLSNDQLPINKNTVLTDDRCSQPLFPFGYGLTADQIDPIEVPVCP